MTSALLRTNQGTQDLGLQNPGPKTLSGLCSRQTPVSWVFSPPNPEPCIPFSSPPPPVWGVWAAACPTLLPSWGSPAPATSVPTRRLRRIWPPAFLEAPTVAGWVAAEQKEEWAACARSRGREVGQYLVRALLRCSERSFEFRGDSRR